MGQPVKWSYSALTAFETCPKRYYLIRVAKAVADTTGEAALWGNKVHQHLEDYANGVADLPPEIAQYARYVDKIFQYEGERIVEKQLAINHNFEPTGWMDDDVWCRGIIDIGVIGESKAYILDWKTGKRKPDLDQLKLFAALTFAHYEQINEVVTAFIWLKDKKVDKNLFTREQIGELWGDFLPRTRRLEIAFETDKWVPRPSGLCKNWCPVGRKLCNYCGS